MAKRISVMLDEDIVKKIRLKQSKLIIKYEKNVSFSRVLNDILKEQLKS